MTDTTPVSGRRLGLLLWATGMLGVAVINATVLPQLLAQMDAPLPAPLWLIQLAGLVQTGGLLALTVWAGVSLAPAVGLDAPAYRAMVARRSPWPALRPQLVPGLLAGVLGGVGLSTATTRLAPAAIAAAQDHLSLPLIARVLYGGITEELLLRWGLMTVFVWLAWRFLQSRRGAPHGGFVWLAIALSALIFGAAHLPAAAALVGLDANVVAYVISVNTAFGLLFGFLYWRFGLESAILAHAVTHVVGYLINPS